MSQSINNRIISVISNVTKIPVENIQSEQLIAELCESSLDLVTLLFDLEDEFNITIPDEARELKTVQDIVMGVEKLIHEKKMHEEILI